MLDGEVSSFVIVSGLVDVLTVALPLLFDCDHVLITVSIVDFGTTFGTA